MGGLVALSRRYFDLHIGVPGHTGILWMFLLVYSRAIVARPGSATAVGVTAALWGELVGFKEALLYNLLLYSSVGLVADGVAMIPGIRLSNPLGGAVAGATAHSAKYGFILVHAKALGLSKKFLLLGVAQSFAYHAAFGALGGLLAGLLIWWAIRRRRDGKGFGV